jgi:hypothetical protein
VNVPHTIGSIPVEITNFVVARYADGRVLKGTTRDFSANRPMFHLEVGSTHEMVEIRVRQLKAVFFVKTFEGSSSRQDIRGFIDGPEEKPQGKKIAVRFRDGEFMCGYTMSWSPDREGFFLFPADTGSNNDRVYVLTAATNEIKAGPAAELLAQRVLAGQVATGGKPGAPASGPSSATMPRPGGLPGRPTVIGPRARPDSAA